MLRPATLAVAASLAAGALTATPAEAAARLPFAPEARPGAKEQSATGVEGAVVELVGRMRRVAGDCAEPANPVVLVGRWRRVNHDCAAAAPVEQIARRKFTGSECAGDAPIVLVVRRRNVNNDCASAGGTAMPVARRRYIAAECAEAAGPVVPVVRRMRIEHDCAAGAPADSATGRAHRDRDDCAHGGAVLPVRLEHAFEHHPVQERCADAGDVVPAGWRRKI